MKNIFPIYLVLILLSACSEVPEFKRVPVMSPPEFGETVTGKATWYGPVFQGRRTDSGNTFDMSGLTASHASFPLGTVIDIIEPESGKKVTVVVNDRHNLERGHVLSISRHAAELLEVYPKKTFTVNYTMIE